MSFAHAPVIKALMIGLGVSSLLLSISDAKHYAHVQLRPHISRDHQYWRLFFYQLAFTNSSDLFLSELLLYHIGIPVERAFGSLKFASFALVSSLLSTLFIFTSLIAFNRIGLNHIPAGPTALILSIVYQYHRTTPTTYTFRISKIDFSNKIFYYILAFQLALSWPPETALTSAIGLLSGALYRSDMLGLNSFRLSPTFQSLAIRVVGPYMGNLQPPVRRNQALPDPFVRYTRPGSTAHLSQGLQMAWGVPYSVTLARREDLPVTTAPTRPPRGSARASRSAGAAPNGGGLNVDTTNATNTVSPTDDLDPAPRSSVLNQFVRSVVGSPGAARVVSEDEIAQLSTMFPDVQRERIVSSLQRSPNMQAAVETILRGES
ncbi:hypothetical protein DL93DRAFT_2148374 [Clavulina sp. PMI_390]|nr:hypothetical protein DL93DRAFT_2148374 [Clavulina sp. PMI_390]